MTDEQHPARTSAGEGETRVHDIVHDDAVEPRISVDETTLSTIAQSKDSVGFTSSSKMETPLSTKQHDQHHADPSSKASGRQAELEELRSKQLAKSIRGEFAFVEGAVPSGTSDLTSFFLQQKEQEQELRRKKQDSAEYLHRYQNSNVPTGRKRSPRGVIHPAPPASATPSEMDLFYQQQRQLGQEWRQHQKDSLDYLHSYRAADIGLAQSRSSDSGGHIDMERGLDVDGSFEARESIIVEDDTDARHYSFEEMQRSLEDRLARAAQCPLPDSFDSIEDKIEAKERQIAVPEKETANCEVEIVQSPETEDQANVTWITDTTNEQGDSDENSYLGDTDSLETSQDNTEKEEKMIHKDADVDELVAIEDSANATHEPCSDATSQKETVPGSTNPTLEDKSSTSQRPKEFKIITPRAHTPSSFANKKSAATKSPSRAPGLSPSGIRLKKAIEEVSRPWRNKPNTPLNLYQSMHQEQKCERRWIPSIHAEKGGCELCLALATEEERQKFERDGHHYRVNIVKGGCETTCRHFPRSKDEPAVRLCRRCFHITHKFGE